MRSPSTWLLLLLVGCCVGNLWTTFQRSGIPLAFEGVVQQIEVRAEKHAGVDDVHLVTIGGATWHLDATIASRIEIGDRVAKSVFSTRLEVGDRVLHLHPDRDFWRMVVALPVVLVGGWLLLRRRRAT